MLTPITFDEWMAALESGNYPKGTGDLRRDNKFCCLGVLADMEGVTWTRNGMTRQYEDGEENTHGAREGLWYGAAGGELCAFLCASNGGLSYKNAERLAEVNDDVGTFAPVVAKARELYAAWKTAQS